MAGPKMYKTVGEDPVTEKDYRIQAMLPWGFETKLAVVLGVIKFPFICLVAFIGIYAENHLKEMTETSWLRYGNGEFWFGTKTGCYAHEIRAGIPKHSLLDIGLFDAINGTLLGGHLQGDVWRSNATLDPLAVGGHPDACELDFKTCQVKGLPHPSYWSGGIDHLISFALIWLIYKLVFIGVHPIDRFALQLAGNPPLGPNYPEPLMKLITEPYFQFCTTPMQVVVKVLFYFRYKMMPNALLGALASLHDMAPHCPKIIYYKMDPRYGTFCYFLCVVDLFGIVGSYVYARIKMDGQLIGRWRYRIWKTLWLISAMFFAYIAVWAAVYTFGGLRAVLQAMLSALAIIFKLDFSLRLNLDLLRVMTFLILFFEGLELIFLIITIVGPRLFPAFFEKFKFLKPESQEYETLPSSDPMDM
eukprot:CAMPEP_0179031158 /NCGR_PEP_ID=MMETSP0796-20121207/10927_1 /TAXON_ID=73915 /ORGANISM="Pyrodinium bahamense, Strain pbaha01" /LENGTH=415 /DNA_ID=CAMNT_0020727343 /DNA_START=36 /DNA_END=1283 /DNA_ORIENTATION=+